MISVALKEILHVRCDWLPPISVPAVLCGGIGVFRGLELVPALLGQPALLVVDALQRPGSGPEVTGGAWHLAVDLAALVHLDTKAGGATVAGFGTDSPCDAYYVLDGVTCTVVGFPTDVYKPSTTGGDFLCVYHASLSIDLAATGGPHPDYHTELAYTAMACIPPL